MSSDAPNTPAAPPAAAAAAAPAPAAAPAQAGLSTADRQLADESLKQMDLLKEQQRSAQQELEKERAKNKALLERAAVLEEKEKAAAEQYRLEREPQAKEYIEAQEKILGGPLEEAIKKQYYNAFTNPDFKKNADILWKQHKHAVELAASAKTKEDALKTKEEELKTIITEKTQLSETLSKVGQQAGGMRASYARSLTPAQTEAAELQQKAVGVNASEKLALGEIMCATPQAWEMQLPFLVKNFSGPANGEVNASGSAGHRRTVMAAREHRLVYDEEGDLNHPASARHLNPALFGFWCNDSGLSAADPAELSNYVQFNAKRTFLEEKRVDAV